MKTCTRCKKEKQKIDFYKNAAGRNGLNPTCKMCDNSYVKNWSAKNSERRNATNKKSNQKTRKLVLLAYGSKCTCCGEKESDFLDIDHINGDGVQHTKQLAKEGIGFTTWLKKNNFPKDFQVLCRNCNWSKYINKGKCIHQIKKGV